MVRATIRKKKKKMTRALFTFSLCLNPIFICPFVHRNSNPILAMPFHSFLGSAQCVGLLGSNISSSEQPLYNYDNIGKSILYKNWPILYSVSDFATALSKVFTSTTRPLHHPPITTPPSLLTMTSLGLGYSECRQHILSLCLLRFSTCRYIIVRPSFSPNWWRLSSAWLVVHDKTQVECSFVREKFPQRTWTT